MASADAINRLSTAVLNLKGVDTERILRPTMGEESLAEFSKDLENFIRKGEFAVEYAPDVVDSVVTQTASVFEQIYQQLHAHAGRTNADFVSQKPYFLETMRNLQEQLRGFWPSFIAVAVEARGFLEDEGIKKEYKKTVEVLESKTKETLKEIQDQAQKTIEEARVLAENIENKARKTAEKISVKDAQEQFENAQPGFNKQVWTWAILSIASIAAFIIFALVFANNVPENRDLIIYSAAIRITVLTAIGATATFCLRILRAQMHMKEQNLHRQRIANSISSFVESASTPEQRDLILAHLVDSVIAFGNSGLISDKDDAISPSKVTIDSIAKNISLGK